MARAYASIILKAPVETVWDHVRDFNGLPSWHPAIAESRLDAGAAGHAVGCVRTLTLKDGGGSVVETLLALSDTDRFYTYTIVSSPFEGVHNYHATLRVTPVTDGGRSFVEWWTLFDCEPSQIPTWVDTFAGAVFKSGLDALKSRFGG